MTPVGKLKIEIVGSEGQMDPQDQGLYVRLTLHPLCS